MTVPHQTTLIYGVAAEKPCADACSSLKQDEQNFETFSDKTILKTEQPTEEK